MNKLFITTLLILNSMYALAADCPRSLINEFAKNSSWGDGPYDSEVIINMIHEEQINLDCSMGPDRNAAFYVLIGVAPLEKKLHIYEASKQYGWTAGQGAHEFVDGIFYQHRGLESLVLLKHFEENGFDVNQYQIYTSDWEYINLVQDAASHGNVEVVRYLAIEKNMPLSNKNITALHLAVIYQPDIEMIKMLVELGVNTKARDNSGKTALDYAVEFERVEMIRYLKSLK